MAGLTNKNTSAGTFSAYHVHESDPMYVSQSRSFILIRVVVNGYFSHTAAGSRVVC